jgi:transcription initiation factor TFIIIB Brf1 subunit/transcription initiation factor TFIIB
MASALGLPRTIRETAAVVYRKAVEKPHTWERY